MSLNTGFTVQLQGFTVTEWHFLVLGVGKYYLIIVTEWLFLVLGVANWDVIIVSDDFAELNKSNKKGAKRRVSDGRAAFGKRGKKAKLDKG